MDHLEETKQAIVDLADKAASADLPAQVIENLRLAAATELGMTAAVKAAAFAAARADNHELFDRSLVLLSD